MLKSLRITALLEGISYLLILGVCMPLKYLYNIPEPTYYIGMAHGVLFVMYVILVLIVSYQLKWKLMTIFLALLASIIPFGTFVADRKIFSKSHS